jgi:colicin import membrane protein
MSTKDKTFDIATLKVNQLPHIAGIEAKQKGLVKENPFIEIIDGATEKLAKARRTALKGGGTEIMNGDKALASGLVKFRKECKTEAERLSVITLEARTKQQTEIDRWEQIKIDKKEAAAKAESLRIENIKGEIASLDFALDTITDKMVFSNIEESINELTEKVENHKIDAWEFSDELEKVIESGKLTLETKVIRLQDEEEKRLELIKAKELAAEQAKELEAVKAEAKKQEEVRQVETNRIAVEQAKKDAEAKIIQDEKDEAARIEREKFNKEREQFEADKKKLEDAQKEALRKAAEEKQAIIDADKKKLADEKLKADIIKKNKADTKRQSELKPFKDAVLKELNKSNDLLLTGNNDVDKLINDLNDERKALTLSYINKITEL